ncbi:MAG: Gfo/Idh/MocA family oxidoreductase, partial [Clostridia bacterium]|nr:Gfo/Idh/MocA family oxidoreductase [Clostridia bacterium]
IEPKAFETQTETNLGANDTKLDFTGLNLYHSPEELFEKEELDFVISALPTYEHSRIAVMALNKGIHVFSEKPMARTLEQGREMIDAAKKNNKVLMIGQCLRYMHPYQIAKEYIDNGKYGKVVRADFYRLSMFPVWGWNNWYSNDDWSGGAVLDLHVHDVDFINWAFGRPKSVKTTVTNFKGKHDTVSTDYEYDGVTVTAMADWSLPDVYPFTRAFRIHFEQAVLELNSEGLILYTETGEKEVIATNGLSPYANEMIDFVQCIKENRWSTINNPDTAYQTIEIVLAEKISGDEKRSVNL